MASYDTHGTRTTDGKPYAALMAPQPPPPESLGDAPNPRKAAEKIASLVGLSAYAKSHPDSDTALGESLDLLDTMGGFAKSMNGFQNFALKQMCATVTAHDPDDVNTYLYPALGLSGETGEVAEKIKKGIRDKGGVFGQEDRDAVALELGDVLFYLSVLSARAGFSLSEIAERNIKKITSRNARGVLQGNGDNR